jgi:hypothetical protein
MLVNYQPASGGGITDPDSSSISIYYVAQDPPDSKEGSLIIQATVTNPVRDSLGNWHYDYVVPSTAPVGVWLARWTATKSGVPSTGGAFFAVSA